MYVQLTRENTYKLPFPMYYTYLHSPVEELVLKNSNTSQGP